MTGNPAASSSAFRSTRLSKLRERFSTAHFPLATESNRHAEYDIIREGSSVSGRARSSFLPQTPVETARALFAALEERAWMSVAELVDSAELDAFRDRRLDGLVAFAESQDIQAPSPERRGISLYFTHGGERRDLEKYAELQLPVFTDVATLGDLAALAPMQFLVKWIEATQRRGGWGSRGPDSRRIILGEVMEGDSLAHVLYRFDRSAEDSLDASEPPEATDTHILTFRRADSVWRALVNSDLVFQPSVMMQLESPHGR
jgi:hypothetical protein